MSAADVASAAAGSRSLTGSTSSGGAIGPKLAAVEFKNAKAKFTMRPGDKSEVAVEGHVDLYGGTDLDAVLSVNETAASNATSRQWAVAFGVAMESNFKLASVDKELAPLDTEFDYGDAMLVASTDATDLTFGAEQRTVKMSEAGVHFQADVPIVNNSKLAPLAHWMGAGDVAAYGTWGASTK